MQLRANNIPNTKRAAMKFISLLLILKRTIFSISSNGFIMDETLRNKQILLSQKFVCWSCSIEVKKKCRVKWIANQNPMNKIKSMRKLHENANVTNANQMGICYVVTITTNKLQFVSHLKHSNGCEKKNAEICRLEKPNFWKYATQNARKSFGYTNSNSFTPRIHFKTQWQFEITQCIY